METQIKLTNPIDRLSKWLRTRLDQTEPPDSLVLVGSALLVGTGTGLAAVLFIRLLSLITELARSAVQGPLAPLGPRLGLVASMGLAGLIVGFMVDRWAREAKGHGVPEVMEAIALRGGRIRARVATVKILASSVTIGAGGSAGREGPIVQAGSAFGSTIGQLFQFSDDRVMTLVSCGAAAGIAATFNAPIAGAIFALEVILGRFTTRHFGAVVLSAVSASIVGRAFLGDRPAFNVPAYALNNLSELPIYLLLGLLSAVVAVIFIRLLYLFEALFDRWRLSLMFKAAIGMMLTALLAFLLPERQVLGPGLHFISEAIAEDFTLPLGLMAALLVLKLLATSFTLGSGNSGGIFAPSLFMGAILGGMVGSVAHSLWPTIVAHPGGYAIVGMAAVFAGAARAPMTAVLIVFEMSNDYRLILPVMMAAVISPLLAEHLFSESIYSLKLKLKGITLQRGRDLDLMQSLLVREAMNRTPYVVEATLPIEQLGLFFEQTHTHSVPVVNENHDLVGIVSIKDYDKAVEASEDNGRIVADIATMGDILVAYEDEPLSEALGRIAVRDINKLPVVSRQDPTIVIGVIRRRDIIKAYNIALTRRARRQLDESKLALPQTGDTKFLEVEIPANSRAANQTLTALAKHLPRDCVIVTVHRHDSMLIPHGDTVLRPEDRVNVFLRSSDEVQLRQCLLEPVKNEARMAP